MIRVVHLYISPGHNYFGHHGQPSGTHDIVEVEQVECLAGRGIREDRFFDFKTDYKGQITFFAIETFREMQREFGNMPDASIAATRRNVITEGADLNQLIGKEFVLQGVRFSGVEECRPCYWMNSAFNEARAEQFLKGRGGLRARILSDGILKREV
jgi:hypothetical protein